MQSNGQLTIGQVAALSGLPAKTIRYYEEAGVIASADRNANSYRTYSEADVQTLRFIAHARKLGFSLKDVGDLLSLYRNRERASKDVRKLALGYLSELKRKIAEMQSIHDAVADLAERCHGDDRPECPIIAELEAPARPSSAVRTQGYGDGGQDVSGNGAP
jgi:MerR family copper efflux transcriptional regulator